MAAEGPQIAQGVYCVVYMALLVYTRINGAY
jgi:hypothetical protein